MKVTAQWVRTPTRERLAATRKRTLHSIPVAGTAHTFRRSCATELVRGGANFWHVKDLLGHENLERFKRYTLLTIDGLKKTHAHCLLRKRRG